jgi:exopolyphosphatase/pppGpp-phosphohydrolase
VSTTTSPRLTDDQQAKFLKLAREADSVELKLTVPELDHASTVAGLGMDPLRAVLAQLGRDSLTVSDEGLRHGVLIERFGRR